MKSLLMKISFVTLILLSAFAPAHADVIPVEGTSNEYFDKGPTMTMLWEAASPMATVVVIMGGGGSVGINRNTTEIKNPTANMMRLLTKPVLSAPTMNVVVYDSPYDLQSGAQALTTRCSDDQLTRIESVVKFYRNKFNHPIWLMGHSNGTLSVAAFINRSDENRKWLSGAILSGSRNESRISKPIDFPVLVIRHQNDGCISATLDNASRHYEQIKSLNSSGTELKSVSGGAGLGNPCTDGYHMYKEAYPEAAKLIRGFIVQSSPRTAVKNQLQQAP